MQKLILLLFIFCWSAPAKAQNTELIQSYVDSLTNLYLIIENSIDRQEESKQEKNNACELAIQAESIVNRLKGDLDSGSFWFEGKEHKISTADHITIRLDHLPYWKVRLERHNRWCS